MQRNTPKKFPVIEMTMGECIGKALEALWEKLRNLGQARLLQNEELPQRTVHTSSETEKKDTTVTEFQCKLLELQLQYIQSLLKESRNSDAAMNLDAILQHKSSNSDVHQEVKNSLTTKKKKELMNIIDKDDCNLCAEANCNKHTQTSVISSSLENGRENEFDCFDQKSHSSCCRKSRTDSRAASTQKSCAPKNHPPVSLKNRLRHTRGHYHLKLSDVPFIVGTSTSSHSVVANVQKIISLMKSHNKGLCSSATNLGRNSPLSDMHNLKTTSRRYRTCSESDLSVYQDVKNVLDNLTEELSTLTLKQENLRQKSETAANLYQKNDILEDCKHTEQLIDSKTKQIDTLKRILQVKTAPGCERKRHRSLSESSSQQFFRNNNCSPSQIKDVGFVKRVSKTEVKHVLCSYSSIPDYTVGCDRRKMMQELKEFQVHLQHEDICWK